MTPLYPYNEPNISMARSSGEVIARQLEQIRRSPAKSQYATPPSQRPRKPLSKMHLKLISDISFSSIDLYTHGRRVYSRRPDDSTCARMGRIQSCGQVLPISSETSPGCRAESCRYLAGDHRIRLGVGQCLGCAQVGIVSIGLVGAIDNVLRFARPNNACANSWMIALASSSTPRWKKGRQKSISWNLAHRLRVPHLWYQERTADHWLAGN